LRDELGAEVDERNYAKAPLSSTELNEIFKDRDPRDFINPKSIAYKQLGLAGKALSREAALKLIAKDSNLLKRPLTIVGSEFVAGFDRERLHALLS
jgi:arsenate reductase-like glutaredoxin family protein